MGKAHLGAAGRPQTSHLPEDCCRERPCPWDTHNRTHPGFQKRVQEETSRPRRTVRPPPPTEVEPLNRPPFLGPETAASTSRPALAQERPSSSGRPPSGLSVQGALAVTANYRDPPTARGTASCLGLHAVPPEPHLLRTVLETSLLKDAWAGGLGQPRLRSWPRVLWPHRGQPVCAVTPI